MSFLFDGLGEAIKAYRIGRRLTRKAAAKAAGVSPSSWASWERKTTPRPESLPQVLKVLECTEAELWQRKTAIELLHYLSDLAKHADSEIPTGFPERLAHIQAFDLENLNPEQRRVMEGFQKTAVDAGSLLTFMMTAMQQISIGGQR